MENYRTNEQLVKDAIGGSGDALESVIKRIQDPVYSLALRMLLNPSDAEDASQEILIIVITKLAGFRFEGSFRSWVMRIAVNKLKAVRRTFMEKRVSSKENLEEIMDKVAAKGWLEKPLQAPEPYIENETKFICTHAVLHLLDRSYRLAFILDVVMGVSGKEGAWILDITPGAYRKRLSRARRRVGEFLKKECGLFESGNRCRCGNIAPIYLKKGWIDPDKPMFNSHSEEAGLKKPMNHYLKEMDELSRLSAIYKSVPATTFDFVAALKEMTQSTRFSIFRDAGAS